MKTRQSKKIASIGKSRKSLNVDKKTFESMVRDAKVHYSKIIENEMKKGNKENLWSLNEIFDFTIVEEQESNEKFYN